MADIREVDVLIAREVFGHDVELTSMTECMPTSSRQLKAYSSDMNDAWLVVEKMNITLIPVEKGQWFALVGRIERWTNPAEFLRFLQSGNFAEAGAAVTDNPALAICLAALNAVRNRRGESESVVSSPTTDIN